MKNNIFRSITLIAISLLISSFYTQTYSQEEFAKPKVEQLVIDEAGIFSKSEFDALTQKLNQFNYETSTQILVYTTNDLQGYDPNDFAQRMGESYGVGSKKNDNGIVILFKPKNEEPGRVAIQVGYGIEHLIPDATANQIIDNEMIPAFKKGDLFGGINGAVDICISLTKGEYTAAHYKEQTKGSSSGGGGIFLIIALIVFFSIFGKSRRSRYNSMGSRSNLPLWAALFMMGSGSSRGSGFSDFSSGSGSFGGGSSFGGFGGGGFGGGGASGSW